MNAFEKYVANEMIAQADRLIGWEYGEEAEAIFGADMDAGFYMNDAMSNEFFNKYTHEIIKCMNDYNIRGEKWKEAVIVIHCIYTVALEICENLGMEVFVNEKYQTDADVEFFVECLKKYMEEN
mgnify:CR=1 FL=1